MKKKRYLLAVVVSLIIACFTFAPINAYAAKTKTVSVITKVKMNVKGYKYGKYQKGGTINYSYNKKGLVKQINQKRQLKQKFTYDNKNRLSVYEWDDMLYDRFKYDKKGRVKYDPAYGEMKYNSKGQLKKRIVADEYPNSYTYSNGVIKKLVSDQDTDSERIVVYAYDSKKNLIKLQDRGQFSSSNIEYANTYKSGRLSKRVATETISSLFEPDREAVTTITYTYKKIKVPASLVSKVKAQQKWVLNGNGELNDYEYPLSAVY